MSKKSKSSSTSQMNNPQMAMLQDVYNRAKAVADKPYQAYGGDTLAGFNQDQTNAFDMVRSGVANNIGGGTLNQAIGGTNQAMAGTSRSLDYNPMQVSTGRSIDAIGQYMNPFLQQVAGNALSDLDRARQLQMQQSAAQARAAGAFGGSRHGVAEAETNRNFYDRAGNMLTGIYSQGFDTAANLANTDLARSLQAQQLNQSAGLSGEQLRLGAANQLGGLSNQLAGLSDQQRQQFFQNAALVEGVGDKQQAQRQAEMDDAYAKWLEAQNYDMNMAGFLGNIVNAMPNMGGTATSTSSPSKASQFGQAIGTIGSIAGMFGFSDKNMKSGRQPVSDEAVLEGFRKTPVETWNYDPAKGGPDDGGVRHIGPMAQGLAKNLGIGNGTSFPVIDMLGTQTSAIRALDKKVRKLEGKKKGGK